MRYLVKCATGNSGIVQVVTQDIPHAIEAARIMMDQGLRDIVVQDTQADRETLVVDFLAANGFNDEPNAVTAPDAPTGR